MKYHCKVNKNPDFDSLYTFFSVTYNELDPIEAASFNEEDDQSKLEDWVDLEYALEYSKMHGVVIEAFNGNGKMVGALIAGKQQPISWPDGYKWEIFLISIDSSSRRRGIGGQLLKVLERAAFEAGAKAVLVNTHINLKSARRFYEKHGYEHRGKIKDYYANGDAYFLIKELDKDAT